MPQQKKVTNRTVGAQVTTGTPQRSNKLLRVLFGGKRKWIVHIVLLVVFGGIGLILLQPTFALTVSNHGCTTRPLLKEGSSGDCVRKLQEALKKRWGYKIDVDGQFGPITKKKVEAFQTKKNLALIDGKVGPNTWRALSAGITWLTPKEKTTTSGGFAQPLNPGSVRPNPTRCVGFYMHPIHRVRKSHNGIDFGAASGTPIYAVKSGRVIASTFGGASGNYVKIDHGSVTSTYMHMKTRSVSVGQNVDRGQKIGTVGSTGSSTDPHLHFELHGGVHVTNGWYDAISKNGYNPACKAGSQTKNM